MMMMTTAATFLVLATTTVQTDTSFKVRTGTRLHVENFGGEIVVQTWDKNAVRIEAEHASRIRVSIEESGTNVGVHASSRRGIPGRVDYRITAPAWMALELSGVYTDVSVEGTKGEVSAETVKGDVSLKGGEGFIKLSSVQGAVSVDGARGRIELSSVNEGVNATNIEGDLSVDAVNGDVVLDRVQSHMIEAATVNGAVRFLGGILDGGRYRFASHNGDLEVAIPERVNATISVATFNGDFQSSFPLVMTETKRGKRFSFTLGNGSALIDLETFQGTINLRRAVMVKAKEKIMAKDKERYHEQDR